MDELQGVVVRAYHHETIVVIGRDLVVHHYATDTSDQYADGLKRGLEAAGVEVKE